MNRNHVLKCFRSFEMHLEIKNGFLIESTTFVHFRHGKCPLFVMGTGINFKPHDSKVICSSVSCVFDMFLMCCLHDSYLVPQKQTLGDFKIYLAIEMSQNITLTHGKLQRCQTLRRYTQIQAEIIQTYDLLNFAIA